MKFSYLFDIQAVLCPSLRHGALLKKMILKMSSSLKIVDMPKGSPEIVKVIDMFYSLIYEGVIWKTIRRLAEQKAMSIISNFPSIEGDNGRLVKRRKTFNSLHSLAMLDELIDDPNNSHVLDDYEGIEEDNIERDPSKMVTSEISIYMNLKKSLFPSPENLVMWWWNQRSIMPCLAEVAAALLASKPRSGGSECDFGTLNDCITSKRSSLGGGFAEASMMLKLNKDLMHSDPRKVVLLENSDWQNYIPNRPIFDDDVPNRVDDNVIVDEDEHFEGYLVESDNE